MELVVFIVVLACIIALIVASARRQLNATDDRAGVDRQPVTQDATNWLLLQNMQQNAALASVDPAPATLDTFPVSDSSTSSYSAPNISTSDNSFSTSSDLGSSGFDSGGGSGGSDGGGFGGGGGDAF